MTALHSCAADAGGEAEEWVTDDEWGMPAYNGSQTTYAHPPQVMPMPWFAQDGIAALAASPQAPPVGGVFVPSSGWHWLNRGGAFSPPAPGVGQSPPGPDFCRFGTGAFVSRPTNESASRRPNFGTAPNAVPHSSFALLEMAQERSTGDEPTEAQRVHHPEVWTRNGHLEAHLLRAESQAGAAFARRSREARVPLGGAGLDIDVGRRAAAGLFPLRTSTRHSASETDSGSDADYSDLEDDPGSFFRALYGENTSEEDFDSDSETGGSLPPDELMPETTCGPECSAFCSICLEACEEGQRMRTVLACGHQFHADCIEKWLVRREWCPNCRTYVDESRKNAIHDRYLIPFPVPWIRSFRERNREASSPLPQLPQL
mmetsp:Transcript_6613/g.14400  ORF Transcript_6613/g.14400 Transcript_6613/m.14400 type:complete len:373 (-) Transcript_6613:32-1150(-)